MNGKKKILSWIFYLSMAAILALFALQKIYDTDVWLHLGIGKYIVEHRALPPGKIFAFTSDGQPYEYFEWLFQAGLYLLYKFAGYDGLMVFKVGLWLLTMGLLWQWMKTEGVDSRWAAFFTFFPAYWLGWRWKERPEVMGYFFLAFYLWTWAQYRRRGRNYLYFLPLCQIAWINFHPSALLGVAVWGIILAGVSLDYFWRKDKNELRFLKALAIVIPLLAAACFLNPYGYKLIIKPFLESSAITQKILIMEWVPISRLSWYHYRYLAFLIPAALTFIPRCFRPRNDLEPVDLALFIFSAFLPYFANRYMVVLALIGLPLAGKNIYWFCSRSGRIQSWWARQRQKLPRSAEAWPLMILLFGVVFFHFLFQGPLFGWGPQPHIVPRQALSFIKQNHIPGPVFNQFGWGGYFILEAYPQYPPYIDSGIYDVPIVTEYRQILEAHWGWERILARRRVNMLMIRSLNEFSGSLIPLIPELMRSHNWLLIWNQDATLVFLRNTPENQIWAQKFALPKARVYEEIIEEGELHINMFNINQLTYGSMGWAYLNMGRFPEAKAAYQKQLKIDPRHPDARKYLEFLAQQGY